MKCEEMPLAEFLRAELDAEETERVVRHAEECETCRERIQVMAALAASAPTASRRSSPPRRLWLIAAALMVGVLAPVLYFELRGPGSSSDLATTGVYPAPFPLVTRDRPRTTEDELRRQAEQAYSEGDYQTAARLFSELPADAPTRFYLGVCQYFLNRYEEAVANLTAAMKDSKWNAPGLWYRASARLRLGQEQQARQDLLQLVRRQDEYGAKAAELLDKLDQMR